MGGQRAVSGVADGYLDGFIDTRWAAGPTLDRLSVWNFLWERDKKDMGQLIRWA